MFQRHSRIARGGLQIVALCAIAAASVAHAQPGPTNVVMQRGVWELAASTVTQTGRGIELHNVRLKSATTYVIAPHVVVDAQRISAPRATVHTSGWTLSGTDVVIAADVDALEIIPRSARAGQE